MKHIFSIAVFISFCAGCAGEKKSPWKRYGVESGKLEYVLRQGALDSKITLYFKDFGETERIVTNTRGKIRTLLKSGQKQYFFVSGSMAITQDRVKEFLWERYGVQALSERGKDVELEPEGNAVSLNKVCSRYGFRLSDGSSGGLLEWKGIPFGITVQSEGLTQALSLAKIDTLSRLPPSLFDLTGVDVGQ
jgi:hypothetical protein